MKVIAGRSYRFVPNLLDQIHVCARGLKSGDIVQVVKRRGAPGPNVMGQCHVNGPDGRFAGMVSCNSLYSKSQLEKWLDSAEPADIARVKALIKETA